MGPNANPRRKRDIPRSATSTPTSNSLAICATAGEYTLLANAAPIVVKAYRNVVTSFFLKSQFSGKYGSSGPSKSTITSDPVRTCARGCVKAGTCLRFRIADIVDSTRANDGGSRSDRLVVMLCKSNVEFDSVSCA